MVSDWYTVNDVFLALPCILEWKCASFFFIIILQYEEKYYQKNNGNKYDDNNS